MRCSKYSANGNDFVVFHSDVKEDRTELAKELCHRQDGVGADGLIVIVPNSDYDFEWQFYNSDGSHADMCGNGSRACAHYAYVNNLASSSMSFLTGAGIIKAEVDGDMVLSELTPPKILEKNIEINGKSWWLIDTGVPHLVHLTENIEEFDIAEARELRYKYNANVNIVSLDGKNLKVRTYERGVEDETLACGTGMAACFYRAYTEEKVTNNIEVYPKSGDTLYLGMNDKTITFRGRVKKTFETDWVL
ncbi:diaminopimelate epimerase [Sulfurimonas gotlandica GD1]|uniref:Diaminopimelate epimerase n=1 Tax=Sulfurimonas gotlandica (strain DSM 19862 / JCM 16533 / GD1) TaxID=929558 RepID=H1FZB2_SULGG|nr:diaminopimelate epimerase [Sulfurimonas gotlandica]EHP29726.1 diaminopimelate epimerase [Sulfurimonas gotlandica GD1]